MSRTYYKSQDRCYRSGRNWCNTHRVEARAAEGLRPYVGVGIKIRQRPLVRGAGTILFNPWWDVNFSSNEHENWRWNLRRQLERWLFGGSKSWYRTPGDFDPYLIDLGTGPLWYYVRHRQDKLVEIALNDLYPKVIDQRWKYQRRQERYFVRKVKEDATLASSSN